MKKIIRNSHKNNYIYTKNWIKVNKYINTYESI